MNNINVDKIKQKAIDKNKDFFGLKSFEFDVLLLENHNDLEQKIGRDLPDWSVGGYNKNKNEVFLIAPWAMEKESSHNKENFPQILIHEITHLYLSKIYPFSFPCWLIEGTVTYVTKGTKITGKIDKKLLVNNFLEQLVTQEDWIRNGSHGAYNISSLWIDFLIKKFKKQRFLKIFNQKWAGYNKYKRNFEEIFKEKIELLSNKFINNLESERGDKNDKAGT